MSTQVWKCSISFVRFQFIFGAIRVPIHVLSPKKISMAKSINGESQKKKETEIVSSHNNEKKKVVEYAVWGKTWLIWTQWDYIEVISI